MLSPRWKKLLGDLRSAKGRMVMMALAIAVGIFGVGTMLSAYSILTREISRNYLKTNPATATLDLGKVDDSLVEKVKNRPEIASAEASSLVVSRIEIAPNEWRPLLLFVVKDFRSLHISTFKPESGAWPPPDGTMLMERGALPLVSAKIGDSIRLQTPNGQKQKILISGSVHDPSLAPSSQEQTAYGYATPSTLGQLGESTDLHLLKVKLKNQSLDEKSINQAIGNLAKWLKQQGHIVEEVRIPPSNKHPHQSQMTSVLIMMLIFSLMALLLSAILTATMIGGLLAQQVRQIGVMKAIGARTWQIAGIYLLLVALIGTIALVIGLPPGIVAGQAFAKAIAKLLNFTLYSQAIPAWIYIVQLLVGILVPLMLALMPIINVTRITVQEAINDYGISRESFGSGRLDTFLGKIRGLDRTLIMALRNTFRQKGRLFLTLGLLSAAGAMFMTSLNVKAAWEKNISDAASNRNYDLEIRLNRPEPEKKLLAIAKKISGVKKVESWNIIPAATNRGDGINIVKTYPDGGHGSFSLRSAPLKSEMIQLQLMSGKWLQPGDTNTVVLNHMAAKGLFPNTKVGDDLDLIINGRPATLRVAGIAREIMTPSAAYVTPDTFQAVTGLYKQSNALRVVMKKHDAKTIASVTKEIESALEKEGVNLRVGISESMLDEAVGGHIYILIFALIMMSIIMAIVGVLGLTSTMSTSVVERTREFGVMRAIGARSSTILRNIISEGLFIGLISWVVSIALSLPLSAAVGNLIGNMSFRLPLSLILSPMAVFIWLTIIIIGSIAASSLPARKASELTIRETLAYV